METAQTEKLKALALAATPGPWVQGKKVLTTHQGCERSWWELCSIMMAPEGKSPHWMAGFVRDQSNADFIAAANPATVLDLIADNERLRAELAERDSALRAEPAGAGLPVLPEPRAIRAGNSFPKVYALAYTADQLREYGEACAKAATRFRAEGGNTNQVGCERDDGLLNIHAESETCEVCSAHTKAREGA